MFDEIRCSKYGFLTFNFYTLLAHIQIKMLIKFLQNKLEYSKSNKLCLIQRYTVCKR